MASSAPATSVEKQHNLPEKSPSGTPPPEPLHQADQSQKPGKIKQGGSGASFTERQKVASVNNLQKAELGKLLKKDLEKKVQELTVELEMANLEAKRQKEKKQREKQRANTLAELAALQSKIPKAPQPNAEAATTVAFKDTERQSPQPPPDPKKDPRVRAYMAQGADLKMAMRMAGLA